MGGVRWWLMSPPRSRSISKSAGVIVSVGNVGKVSPVQCNRRNNRNNKSSGHRYSGYGRYPWFSLNRVQQQSIRYRADCPKQRRWHDLRVEQRTWNRRSNAYHSRYAHHAVSGSAVRSGHCAGTVDQPAQRADANPTAARCAACSRYAASERCIRWNFA